MTDYPYGRSGYPHCYRKNTATKTQLEASAENGDNQILISGSTIRLYEAPTEDEPEKGYYSVWKRIDGQRDNALYEQERGMEGDDRARYQQFQVHI